MLVPLLGAFFAGCMTTDDVTPVGDGVAAWGVGFGGPLTLLKDNLTPAPIVALRTRFGVAATSEVQATLLATPLLFGLLTMEVGYKTFLVSRDAWVPTLGLSLGALVLAGVRPGAVSRRPLGMPLSGATAAWRVGPGDIYGGGDVLWDPYPLAYETDAPRYIVEPLIGYRYELSLGTAVSGEVKKFVANWRTDQVAADLFSLDAAGTLTTRHPQNGALGLLVSIERRY